MAAPSIVGSAVLTATGDGTSHSITLPATTPGNGIVVGVGVDDAPTVSIDTGVSGANWVLGTRESNGAIVTGCTVWKPSSSGSDVLTITTSTTQRLTAVAYEVSGHDTTPVESRTNGSGANSDPASVALDSGLDYRVLAFRMGDATVSPTAQPTGYSTLDTQSGGSGASTTTSGCHISVTGSSSEDPGPFTVASEQWVCITFAIPEPSGGGPTFVSRLALLGVG